MADDAKLIVGLGNPGTQYQKTRHNMGFMCLEALASRAEISGKSETKFKAIVGRGHLKTQSIILVQPLTFMNLSGEALIKVMQFYKIEAHNVLVVFDDIDLPFGKIRFREKGSAGSHNGMKSVISCLGTDEIPRLRVGVGAPPPQWDLIDYVLAAFTPEEQEQLPKVIDYCVKAMTYWTLHPFEDTRNRFNGGSAL